MADDIFNVEPPRWLQAIAQPIDTKLTGQVLGAALAGATNASARQHEAQWQINPATGKQVYMGERGGSWFSNFLGATAEAKMNMADPFWRIKADQLKLKTATDILGMIETKADIDLKRESLAENAHDASAWPKWLQDNKGNYLQAEPPDLRSPKYNNLYNQFLAGESARANTRITSYAVRDFYKRLDLVPPSERYGVASLMPQAGDPEFDTKFKVAQGALEQAETKVAAQRTGAGPAGMTPRRFTTKDWMGNTTVYEPPASNLPGPVLTDWNRRMDWLRNADYESYRRVYTATPPDTSTPEGQAQMNLINDVEGAVRARLEKQNQDTFSTPGATVTTTTGPGGVATRSVSITPLWEGEPPPSIQLSTGDQIIPEPVYSGSRDRIIGYKARFIGANGQQHLLTPQALSAMARDKSDQLTMAGLTKKTDVEKAQLQKDIAVLNRLSTMLVEAQTPALVEQANRWKGIPAPLPVKGTNPPAGKTVFDFGTNGVLDIQKR